MACQPPTCPHTGTFCPHPHTCNVRKLCVHRTVATIDLMVDGVKPALHFVGFRNAQQFQNAVAAFGNPDFVHVHWDQRAVADFVPGWDKAVFAKGDANKVVPWSFDDSNQPDDPAAKERL